MRAQFYCLRIHVNPSDYEKMLKFSITPDAMMLSEEKKNSGESYAALFTVYVERLLSSMQYQRKRAFTIFTTVKARQSGDIKTPKNIPKVVETTLAQSFRREMSIRIVGNSWRDVESSTSHGGISRHLDCEGLGLLSAEVLVGEVTVLSSLEVDWLSKVKFLDNDTWS